MTKKKLIEQSAQKLFSQFGIKKITTDDIAKEAGVSKATIYKFYKNKNEIFNDVVKSESDLMIKMMRKAVCGETSASLKIKALLLTKITKVHELINFYRVTRENWGDHWPCIEEARIRFMDEEKQLLGEILSNGNDSGELSLTNIPLHSHILMIILQTVESPWATDFEGATLEEIVDLIVDTFICGVGGKSQTLN